MSGELNTKEVKESTLNSDGTSKVYSNEKFNSEKRNLYKMYPGENRKFIFGNEVNEDFLEELYNIFKKYNRTNAKDINEFLNDSQ